MKLPWSKPKEPVGKRVFVGMSKKTVIPKAVQPKKQETPEVAPTRGSLVPAFVNPRNLFHGIKIYLALIKSDIKHMLKVDKESRTRRQEYEDFMDTHFGKDWRRMR